MLSRPTITADGTALLDLSLSSPPGAAPAALQWTLQYSPTVITSFAVDDGPSLTSAGKTSICAGDAAAYNCLAIGANTNAIANGVIATLTAVLAPGFPTPTVQIQSALGASPEGYLIPIRVSTDCRLRPLRKRSPAKVATQGKKE
jgi:hypothetical protein